MSTSKQSSDIDNTQQSSAADKNEPNEVENEPNAVENEPNEVEKEGNESAIPSMDYFKNLFSLLKVGSTEGEEEEKPEQLLTDLTFPSVVEYIKSDKCKNIIVMCGAGISTSAGIPDFRSPGTGLYDNLQKYDLPNPQAIFEINFFKENPLPFYTLAKELYPGIFKPTYGHYFIKLLENKGYLQRVYSQNIDTLERVAEISGEKIVEAHGTFYSAHCIECKHEYSQEWVKDKVFKDEIPHCTECESLVKPDIVFFGESLPRRFVELRLNDFATCDLLIIMGTSLKVNPFASLVGNVTATTPRLLINREKCGETDPMMLMMGFSGGTGLDFDSKSAYRDVAWLGDCDDVCKELCEMLGWGEDLKALVETGHAKIDAIHKLENKSKK